MTLMETPSAVPVPAVTPGHVMTAPLPRLFEELGVRLVEAAIADGSFFGAVARCRDGQVTLVMPSGRSSWERDTIARVLIGNALGVGLSPLPSLFEVAELA